MEQFEMAQDAQSSFAEVLRFGPFRFHPGRRQMYKADRLVALGSRAVEILLALLERPGELIGKRELIARVWPNSVAEESTLRVHIAALRKALGNDPSSLRYIENVSGQGYRFLAPVTRLREPSTDATPAASSGSNGDRLPVRLTRMIGREHIVKLLAERLSKKRFLTIVGPGGVGKTTVALAVGEKLSPFFSHGVRFVDLATLSHPALVAGALASALGLAILSENPLHTILAFLREQSMLIVLDNCEHVVEAAAHIAESVLKGAPQVHLLTTSREPLRAESECVHLLAPLESPPASAVLSLAQALEFPAMLLFVERATACVNGFELRDADVPVMAEICRRLDGNALAIELAAARVGLFAIRDLAACLDDRFQFLNHGRRTSLPRHHTLRATLDWSHDLLSPAEQMLLRRLSVFAGSFDMGSVSAVATDENADPGNVLDCLVQLVAKSLVTVDATDTQTLYRLLETPRAYAREKLEKSHEHVAIRNRHAQLCCTWDGHDSNSHTNASAQYPSTNARRIDDVRAALDWCFSAHGDASLGVQLTAASGPLWFELSILNEYQDRLRQALKILKTLPEYEAILELELTTALGDALHHTKGVALARATYRQAIEIADRLGVTTSHRRALWSLWNQYIVTGEFQAALAVAEKHCGISENSQGGANSTSEHMMAAMSYHFGGRQAVARRHAERVLSLSTAAVSRRGCRAFQLDARVIASAVRARCLWIQGFADQAMQATHEGLEIALSSGHIPSLCYASTGICAVPLWAGDASVARRILAMLLDQAGRHSLDNWHLWARGFTVVLDRRDNDTESEPWTHLPSDNAPRPVFWDHLATFDARLVGAQTLTRAEEQVSWCTAEVLRAKAEMILRSGDTSTAEALLQRSFDISHRQGDLSWQLRAAMSLSRLWQSQDRAQAAHDLLISVYGRFTEGFATRDLLEAKALMATLR